MVRVFKSGTLDTFKVHKADWKDCQRCPLHKDRRRVIFFRGYLPCDYLLIGEAPGESEDVLGEPFVGEAGKKLDEIIDVSDVQLIEAIGKKQKGKASIFQLPRYCITNIVGCWPTQQGENCRSTREPTKEEAATCQPKLLEFLKLAKPKLIVTLGVVAKKYFPKEISISLLNLIHPSAILRDKNQASARLKTRRAIASLSRRLQEL